MYIIVVVNISVMTVISFVMWSAPCRACEHISDCYYIMYSADLST